MGYFSEYHWGKNMVFKDEVGDLFILETLLG